MSAKNLHTTQNKVKSVTDFHQINVEGPSKPDTAI